MGIPSKIFLVGFFSLMLFQVNVLTPGHAHRGRINEPALYMVPFNSTRQSNVILKERNDKKYQERNWA